MGLEFLQKSYHYFTHQVKQSDTILKGIGTSAGAGFLGTAETVVRFILPVMDAYDTFSGKKITNSSLLQLKSVSDWTKEAICSLHSIKGYSGYDRTIINNFVSDCKKNGYLHTTSKGLSWLSHDCSTIKFWQPQTYLKANSPIFRRIESTIGNWSIYQSTLPDNIKPLKDKLYAGSVLLYFIAEAIGLKNEGKSLFYEKNDGGKILENNGQPVIDKEKIITYCLKFSKLMATLFGGKVFAPLANRKLCVISAVSAGTFGMINLGMSISNVKFH